MSLPHSACMRSACSPACNSSTQMKTRRPNRAPRSKRDPSSKSGCLKCRVRKKKCDGRKPTCLGCERNHLLCNWPVTAPTIDTRDDSQSDTSPALTKSYLNKSTSITSGPESLHPAELSSSPSPIDRRRSAQIQISNGFTLQSQINFMLKDTKSLMLYDHWLRSTGNALSMLRDCHNAFITQLPKLALYYPNTVLPSLLALSGIHYCNKTENSEVEQLAYLHLAQALQSLKYGITKYVSGIENDPLPLLVTTLILCFTETTRGDDKGNVVHHLRAARPLLLKILSCREFCLDDSILEFLKEYYTYIACITHLTTSLEADICRTNLLAGGEQLMSTKSSGLLLGCAHRLYGLIPELSKIASQQRNIVACTIDQKANVATDDYNIACAWMDLQSQILGWQPPCGSTYDSVLCGRIYQQALLVYLDSLSPQFPQSPRILSSFARESLDIITNLLVDLPLDAPSSATLIWPLAFLGTQATEWYHRDAIRARLQAIWNNMAAVNVKATISFLEKCWACDNRTPADQGNFALEDYMKLYGMQISFV